MNNTFKKIIEEICIEEKINYKFLSKDWITMLEKDGKTRFISGYKFDLNSHGLGTITDDKYALYEILHAKNIPVVEHRIVYRKGTKAEFANGCNTYEYVKEYFRNSNYSIVVKPNRGTCGRNVFHVTDENEIYSVLDIACAHNYSISICPFYKIKQEIRGVILDGNIELLYGKNLPKVYGDGKKTIRELLTKINPVYFNNRLNNEKYDIVLEKNEEYLYNWKFNLSQGSIPKKIDDKKLLNEVKELIQKTAKEINLGFGSVDVIQTDNNKLFVLEVNSGVMLENYINCELNGFEKAKEIYKKAINKMFIE